MIVNDDRKTTPRQRIVIILIAVFMLGSTFALYAGIVLSYKNNETQQELNSQKINRYSELYAEYQDRVNQRASELSAQYFDKFKDARSRVKAFNAADVNNLVTEDIVVGDGAAIEYAYDEEGNVTSYNTNYSAYYIGWLSDETIFDSSFDSTDTPTSLKSPLGGTTNMIQGWIEGIEGMHLGGIREITIPSIMAYGENDQGVIPANSPLKFVVMLIEKPTPVEIPDELEELNIELNGYSLRQYQ